MRWVNSLNDLTYQPSSAISDWLTKPYILSRSLKQVSDTFSVHLISQQFLAPFPEEKEKLNIRENELPLVREVFLQGDGIALTYGRVIVPEPTYQRHFGAFDALGSQPIGETMLYNNPEATRSGFEYTMLDEDSDFAKTLFAKLPFLLPQPLWGRRSVFWLREDPLLVTEFFLPTLPVYPEL